MKRISIWACVLTTLLSLTSQAAVNGKHFDHAIFVIFENTDSATAAQLPFFRSLANQGANLINFLAITHPSQGNYIALTSGDLQGVSDDRSIDLKARNIVDLLEAQGLTWKVYAEDYPGNCYAGDTYRSYARKHNPFISYLNVQTDSSRCAHIVNAAEFDTDTQKNQLPNYVFYIPNLKNDGHNTSPSYADKWYGQKFSSYVNDSEFMKSTVLITTFDESNTHTGPNQIYTTLTGANIKPQNVSKSLTTYSLLALIEDNWNLGDLGLHDASAPVVPDIWH